jgi:hypothetical protein
MKLQATDRVTVTHDIVVCGSFVPAGTEGVILTPPSPRLNVAIVEFQDEENNSIIGEVLSIYLKQKPKPRDSRRNGLIGWFRRPKKSRERL